jgi:hypothetical protein
LRSQKMLNDEQILLKAAKLLENVDISNKKPEKLLREITEDELEVIQDVLDDLKGENLAFNDLFDGNMRKVIDFPTLEVGSDLGKFVDAFKVQEYDVDWDKGIVSGEKELQTADQVDVLAAMLGPGPDILPKKRKIQLKIGKFFAKITELASKRDVLAQKVYDYLNKIDYSDAEGKIIHPGQLTGKMIKAALSEEEKKRYRQLNDQLDMYIPNPGMIPGYPPNTVAWATKMAKYWQENAGYIKKEIKNLKNDKYSMIITRYPIDVMRMSDFESITSCHSPPSRGQTDTSYYKCAVAEAMGHGAIAYVVETDDLLHMTNTSNIDSAEQEIQEGEIFADDTRNLGGATSWSPTGQPKGELLSPISRIRLRQMRYYDTDQPKRWDEGTEVAVPETRVYGSGIPGISDRITAWAKENQEKVIENMPKSEDDPKAINLDRFWMFGGSYEDTSGASGRKQLLAYLTGIDKTNFKGNVRQNEDTENDIDVNLLGNTQLVWEQEIERITEEWNRQYAATIVQAWVRDYGEGLSIEATWSVVLDWDMDEFVRLPNSHPTGMDAAEHINGLYGDIFDVNEAFLNKTTIDGQDKVRWGCSVNLEHPEVLNEEYFYDPEGLNEACHKIDVNIDDKRDGFKVTLEEFFKQEGWMEGGEYIKLAYEIEDTPFESYEWDVRYDGEHPPESYEATAAVSHDFNPKELGVDPRVLFDLLDSRDWRIAIRTRLLKSAQIALGTEYHLDIENSKAVVPSTGEVLEYTLTLRITSDDPDERVKLFRELTTGEDSDMDDADNLKAAFDGTMAQFLNSRSPSHMQQNLDERLVKTWKEFIGR